jgi:hypothetical protein
MYSQWIRMEHHRMHLFETWPDGPRKAAHLAAAKSALKALENAAPEDAQGFVCAICAARRRSAPIIEFRPRAPFPMAA